MDLFAALTQFDRSLQLEFIAALKEYEQLTGFVIEAVRSDGQRGLLVNCAYDDGAWAGSICCELPLPKATAKVSRYVEQLRATGEQLVVAEPLHGEFQHYATIELGNVANL